MLALLTELDRPDSPDVCETASFPVLTDEELYELSDEDPMAMFGVPNVSRAIFLPPPPLFDPPALAIMYFDIYGTLIVRLLIKCTVLVLIRSTTRTANREYSPPSSRYLHDVLADSTAQRPSHSTLRAKAR